MEISKHKYFYLSCLFACLVLFSCKQKKEPVVTSQAHEEVILPDTLRLLFVGDVMVHSTQYNAARYEGGDSTYNFYPVFQYIEEYISSADLSFANLEVPFGGKPYSGYPMFSSPPEIADDLKKIGFDILFTANNHVADRGKKGLEGTIDHLSAIGLKHLGSYKDSLARSRQYPMQIEKNNIKLSILNYTYGTNGMPVYKPNLVNVTDTIQVLADLQKAKAQNPDFIVTCMHWGEEYHQKESENQRKLAHFLAENGTDLIIGAHPHVIQPFDHIVTQQGDSVPVIYSLGNFVSNQQWRYADGGIAFEAILEKKEDKTALISVAYEPLWVNRFNDPIRTIYRIIPVSDYYRNPEKYELNAEKQTKIEQFYEDTRKKLPELNFSRFFSSDTIK